MIANPARSAPQMHPPSAAHRCWLAPHVFACWPNGSAVLLDLKQDRYFALAADDSRIMRRLLGYLSSRDTVESDPAVSGDHAADSLVATGLLVREEPLQVIKTSSVQVDGTLASITNKRSESVRIRPHHVFNHARACLWAKFALNCRSLYSVACEVSRAKQQGLRNGAEIDPEALADLVHAFRQLRALTFTARNHCLFHALALTRFLASYNIFTTWVIGVTITPWAAHSWVQFDRTVLDSTPEHIADFEPILVI
jgi:hypothetical protein